MEQNYIFIVIVSVIYFLLLLYFYKSNNFNSLEKFVEMNDYVDINFIKNITYYNSLYRPVNSKNLETVKLNIYNELKTIPNFLVKTQSFTRKINNKNYNFTNIIGNSIDFIDTQPYIILSAHIDGPYNYNCKASIDAMTSIGIIIEITKKLLYNNKKYNIQIVFFDGEEAIDGSWTDKNTLSGSLYFVKNLKTMPAQVFVFDLIGGDIEKNKLYGYSKNPKSHLLMSKLSWINNSLYPEDQRIFVDPNETISYATIKDDALPFYNANIPVIDLIPPTFPLTHHTDKDNYENVNWKYVKIFANVIYKYLKNNPV